MWLENHPIFVFSSGIQHSSIILVSTNIIEREDFSEPPCCFNEGIMCQSRLSCYPLDSQSTEPDGFEGSRAVLLPHQHREDPRRGIWASQAAELYPRHLPTQMWFGTQWTHAPFWSSCWRLARRPWNTQKTTDICTWVYQLPSQGQCHSKLAY